MAQLHEHFQGVLQKKDDAVAAYKRNVQVRTERVVAALESGAIVVQRSLEVCKGLYHRSASRLRGCSDSEIDCACSVPKCRGSAILVWRVGGFGDRSSVDCTVPTLHAEAS